MPAALADPAARLYLFRDDLAMLKHGSAVDPLFTLAEAEAFGAARDEIVLLGWSEERAAAGGDAARRRTPVDENRIRLTDLRTLAVEGEVAARPSRRARAGAQPLLLEHPPPLLRRLRRADGDEGRRLPPRMPVLRRAAFSPHRPGGDHARHRRLAAARSAACSAGRRASPTGMYSCLAGFVEPGETIEDAVRRETAEEAGIRLGRVRYHSSQPWPFPCSLMIGCHGEALTTDITRDEAELEDARWFSARRGAGRSSPAPIPTASSARRPIAIAHKLIRFWAEGR